MGQALYRKYRSKSLNEIVGQEHITRTLQQAIASGRISHAYLFTGPRGVGKTSIARILAHELNNLTYTGEDSHLDIIEIDAASNGGVDEIRDLRDKVYVAPTSGKYKVYIIDEVHMMTTSAFNALLKTLEEPPAHAVFILATTEAHKLPATIISRTQRFTFKPIPRDQVVAHLRHIADTEQIDITDDALDLIAEHGGGSFRDSISMLDQAGSAHTHVTRDTLEKLLGIPPVTAITQLLEVLASQKPTAAVQCLTALKLDGYQAAAIAKQLAEALRTALLDNRAPLSPSQAIALLKRLIDVPASHDPDRLLELVVLETMLAVAPASDTSTPRQPAAPAPQAPPAVAKPAPRDETPPSPKAAPAVVAPPKTLSTAFGHDDGGVEAANDSTLVVDEAAWQTVLESLKKQYNTLYGIVRMAQPEFQPGKVKLIFGFAFHQKRASDAKNKKIIMATLEEVTGQRIGIECRFDKSVTPPSPVLAATPSPAAAPSPSLGAISNIFGGGEVLSS